ncbi:hypothetical protein RGR602_CH03338 [Rhizobium gallicum bv. gallicum R602sp]|uniref:Uncharacterized protein n=1 Tax=Rhizobium gallicum bv. gallicum R602sp TaxID=1041138 RepID=A0A0B4X836_9HYPH|nr:hypothetical protein RGR602_CH03338 [Rhizobium gallicum bv. gallicum R602sp]
MCRQPELRHKKPITDGQGPGSPSPYTAGQKCFSENSSRSTDHFKKIAPLSIGGAKGKNDEYRS